MKATKYTVTITVECLSMDAVRGIVSGALAVIHAEHPNGELASDDGDFVKWATKSKSVEF